MDTASVETLVANRFVLHERIGEGGMGRVHRAFDRKMGCDVAFKTLQQLGPEQVYLLKREFRLFAEVVHPNLVELYNLVADGRAGFFTMELLQGTTLVEHVRWKGFGSGGEGLLVPPTSAEIERLERALLQLAAGLAALHAADRLHRDVKPANVMVTVGGRVVLLDFGLAALIGSSGAGAVEPRGLTGTIDYMSPEQAWGEALSPASDWYSVGVMLYEALTGRLPFEGPPARTLVAKKSARPPRPGALVRGVPEDLDRLVWALLDPDPARRPGADEVVAWSTRSEPGPRSAQKPPARRSFIGREREIDAIRSVMAAARARGAAALVHLRGPSGIGKSALLGELTRRLEREEGALVLGGRCHPQESVPWKGLDGVVDGLNQYLYSLPDAEAGALRPDHAAALARLFPVLQGSPGWDDEPEGEEPAPQELRRRGVRALRDLLSRIAAGRPVLLSIDDLQWRDADTAEMLAELFRDPPPPVALVLASRDGDADAADLALPLPAHEIVLGPMSSDEIVALSRAILAADGAAVPDVAAIVDESAGNPFFVGELTRWTAVTGHREGLSADHVIRDRIGRLGDDERRLIEVVALAGRPLPRSLALRAAGVAHDAQALVLRLRLERILRGTVTGDEVALESAHDRIREAVVAAIAPEVRRARHRDIAAALEARPDPDPQQLLEHLLGADDRERAGACALVVAEAAASALAFNRAAHHYRLALDLRPEDATTWSLHEKLGSALANAGRTVEAAGAYEQAAAALSRQSPSHASLLALRCNAAEQYLRGGRIDEGLGALRAVLSATGLSYPETTPAAIAEVLARRVASMLRGLPSPAASPSGAHPRDMAKLDACWSACLGLNMIDILRSAVFQARHASLALRAGDTRHLLRALGTELCYTACEGGRAKRARVARLKARVEAFAARSGDAEGAAFVELCIGAALYFEGRFREALPRLDAAEAVFRRRHDGITWEVANCRMYRAWSLSWLGELGDLGRVVPALVDEARAQHNILALAGLASTHGNLVWLAADRPRDARAHADLAVAPFPATSFQSPHYFDLVAQARIDLHAGDGEAAFRRVEEAWPKLEAIQFLRMQLFRVELCYLRACAALAASRKRSGRARDACLSIAGGEAKRLGREDHVCARPLALLAQAGLLSARGARREAERAMGEAARAADLAGLGLHAACARARLDDRAGAAWMKERGVARGEAMADAIVPALLTSSR